MSIKNFSVFSLEFGMLSMDDIIGQEFTAKTQTAFLTDLNTLAGTLYFYDKCIENNIKPIFGVVISIGTEDKQSGTVTLYAKNEMGFNNLKKIVSSIYTTKDKVKYTSMREIQKYSNDLIAVIGGHGSELHNLISLGGKNTTADDYVSNLIHMFPNNLSFEIQITSNSKEDEYKNNFIIKKAKEKNINVFNSNNNLMKNKNYYPLLIEKIKTFNGVDNKINKKITDLVLESNYIRSGEENEKLFLKYKDDLTDPLAISNQVENFNMFTDTPLIPYFPNTSENDNFIKTLSRKYKEFIVGIPKNKRHIYKDRIIEEVNIIKELKFEKYFTIFDQINKNIKEGNKVNLRGSSVSFLTTHILGLSNIDPVEQGLLPERFLNRNRLTRHELPDIDLESNDVSDIHDFVISVFGEKNIAYVGVHSTQKVKSQIKMAERALKHDIEINPFDKNGDRRVFPQDDFNLIQKVLHSMYGVNNMTLCEAIENGYVSKKRAAIDFNLGFDFNSKKFKNEYYKISTLKKLSEDKPSIKKIIGYIKNLDGIITRLNMSSSSIVISNNEINEFFSTKRTKDRNIKFYIEASKKHVEKLGLIKLDILPNLYLGKLEKASKLIGLNWENEKYGDKYADKNVYSMIGDGKTTTLNQIKSVVQQELAKKIQISNFKELVSFLALIRPGVGKANIDKYIENKKNIKNIHFENKDMRNILAETYGIIIFEEQIMLIAQKIGNFSKEESDDFRSLMKKVDVNDKKSDTFFKLEKMKNRLGLNANKIHNLPECDVKSILKKLEDMQGYTFSKAHSLSYSALLYKQAFVDVNYPAEYIQTHLITDKNKINKGNEFLLYVEKINSMGRKILNPDINRSAYDFKTIKANNILYIDVSLAFTTKDEKMSNIIIEERILGDYKNLDDFVSRTINLYTNTPKISGKWLEHNNELNVKVDAYKKALTSLINTGCFDKTIPKELKNKGLVVSRSILLNSIDAAINANTSPFVEVVFNYIENGKMLTQNDVIKNEVDVLGISPTKIRAENKKKEIKNKSINVIKKKQQRVILN